jgi:hypothetical protein
MTFLANSDSEIRTLSFDELDAVSGAGISIEADKNGFYVSVNGYGVFLAGGCVGVSTPKGTVAVGK